MIEKRGSESLSQHIVSKMCSTECSKINPEIKTCTQEVISWTHYFQAVKSLNLELTPSSADADVRETKQLH